MHDATTLERARAALSYLNPDCDRDTWVKYAMCMKNEFGEDGFDAWDNWSSSSEAYRASDARSVWKSVKSGGKTTFGSLIYDAKSAGFKDDATYKKPSAAEIEERKAASALRAEQAAKEEAAEHAKAAERAVLLWDEAKPAEDTSHPYLKRKGVAAHGLRIGRWERLDEETGEWITVTKQGLLVPIRDRTRKLWSLQCIHPSADKKKMYLRGGAKRGHFHAIGTKPLQHDGRPVFVVAEGYATSASVHEATGHLVLCCFDVSNLMAVAGALRERSPGAVILIAADNDTQTEGNPGVTQAKVVAKAVGGLVAVPPPGDFNDLHLSQGLGAVAEVVALTLDPPPADLPPDEPPEVEDPPTVDEPKIPVAPGDEDDLQNAGYFTILGYDNASYWVFHHEKRQVLERTKGDFSDQGLVELAPVNFWEMNFGNPNGKGGIDRTAAFEWFIAVAHRRGIYDPRRIRGRGAWHDKGRSVYHLGDHLSVDGARVEIATIDSRWVYPMAQSLPNPAKDPVTDAEGKHLLAIAQMARWTRPGSAALLAGWVFLSPVCGALSWRPHIWITGAAGSGKSTLQSEFADALLTGIGHPFQGDSTEAGIRQTLRADAIPALIDEFEPNDEADRKRMKSILTLIRQSSSESAAQTAKGTVSGDSMRFHIRSMFCLASVNTMLDKDSDQSRITPLVLRPPAQSGAADDRWAQLEEELHKIGKDGRWPARLLARALNMLPTILANVDVFSRVAAKRFGTQRHGDQYGTLLAGAWCLTSGLVATDAQALAMINAYDWTDHTESSGGPGDPEKALSAIMESKIRVSNVDVTVFEILSEFAGKPVSSSLIGAGLCEDILKRNGIRLEGQHILFGVTTGSLKTLAKDTPYATDIRGQLSRLPGATNFNNKTRKYAGTNSKVISVPLSLVLDDPADDELPI